MSFKIGGCKITVSFFFFAVLCICSLADSSSVMLSGLLAALLHECGHLATVLFFGLRPQSVSVSSAGFVMHIPQLERNRKIHILTALSGGVTNLILFLLFFPLWKDFAAANLALCILSLLPCDPFDGGIIIRSVLEKYMPERKADHIMLLLTLTILVCLIIAGTMILFRSKYNLSLLTLSMLIFTTICQRTLK